VIHGVKMERKKLFNKACTKFKRRKKIELAKIFRKYHKNVKFPIFKIEKNPIVSVSEIKARRFYIIDQAQIKAKEKWAREEDEKIFSKINNIISSKRLDTSPLKKKKGESK
jgi:hypothetical protein